MLGRVGGATLGLCVAAAGVAVGVAGCAPQISDANVKPITLAELKPLTDAPPAERKVLLIDPRAPGDFAQGHLPGARNLQVTAVSGRPGETDPELTRFGKLVVYGNDAGTGIAVAMAKQLLKTGYENVRFYTGGLAEWARSGYRVERTAP